MKSYTVLNIKITNYLLYHTVLWKCKHPFGKWQHNPGDLVWTWVAFEQAHLELISGNVQNQKNKITELLKMNSYTKKICVNIMIILTALDWSFTKKCLRLCTPSASFLVTSASYLVRISKASCKKSRAGYLRIRNTN